ncbi:hydrolase [Leifsonia sp. LS1]|uniref:alpha/beta fold hydrolase n=1 Tax=Leifsonia sp. LS1 TaxID=2828483 RepID=UPI001CFC557F|nr:alpha/beta hydrolase [Leifsonia sp. LS1]GIT79615.1 hydrolase [Leifsonia sp. LS1]
MTTVTTDESARILSRSSVRVQGAATGRPLVFAHGFGCSQEMWRLVAPAFEAEHPVVLFDLVGSGSSDLAAYDAGTYDSLHGYADDVIEIAETLDLHDAVLVGHSVSAMIGVLAASRRPDLFGALALVSPSPRYVDDVDYRGGFSQADIDALLDALDRNYLGWSAAIAPQIMGNPGTPALGDELTESFCRTDPEIARRFAQVTFLSDNRRDLAKAGVPTLVLQCSEDIIAPVEVGRYVHESIPGSVFVQLEATGHCPHLSSPREVIDAVRGFLA